MHRGRRQDLVDVELLSTCLCCGHQHYILVLTRPSPKTQVASDLLVKSNIEEMYLDIFVVFS